ncbi:unnamed protein product [Rhizophagus irregularis]|uniref:BED-type domain-containing protein n=1 Tax=Rhizophagus irregularis TaxID=588596 RepID=A0A916E7K9_9GLOM|nr:unnamed protein product [Rhizophagus irregularis]
MDTPTEQQKKKGGRPQSEVWRHYEKKPLKSAGHFSAKCNYCRTDWPRDHPNELEDHLANNCRKVPELVHSFYLGVVSAQNFGREDTFSSPENSKKRKTQVDQRELTHWFKSTNINSQKKASITRALVRTFICCGILFSIIENPFFIEFLHEMRPGYEPPTSELLKYDLAKITISSCNQITSFFKRSHIVGKLLSDATNTLQIVGEGLKTYCETKWTSMYEVISSMSRLRIALEHVLKNNPNEITNKSVRRNIRSSEFFSNVDKLTKVLKPIKTAITLLESANANLADCFLQLILIANTIKKLPSREMKTITTTAAQIWQNNGGDKRSCNRLLAQIRNYELQKSLYNQEIDSHLKTPIKEEDEIDNRRNIPISEIPNHEVRVLIIEEMFNLKNAVKCLNNDGENSDDSDINDDVNETDGEDELDDSENVEMESNYDVKELIQQYSLDNELEGDTL